jgi:hypothetical protein
VAQQILIRTATPTKGLYTSQVPDGLGPEYSPWCQNVRFRHGEVMKCPGRSTVLQTLPKHILDFALHTDISGNKTVFALTADALDDNAATPYNATTHQLGTAIALPPVSQLSRRFSWTQGEEQLFIVRASTVSAIKATSPGVFSVEVLGSPQGLFVEYFNNRVFLMNIINFGNRVQWSARANYTDWVQGQGRGGWLDLYDGTVENITGGRVLNDRLVIYRNSSITDFVATGDDITPFLPQGKSYGVGCQAPWTLQSVGQFHIFLGNDFNVYVWDGTRLQPIGNPVHTYIRQILDQGDMSSWKNIPFAAVFMGFKEYHLVIPQWQSSSCVVLIYDYLRDTWTRDVFTNLRALFEYWQTGLTGSPGYDGTGYPAIYPVLLASRDKEFFVIDERIDGDRLSRPADGGIEMLVDTPDMYWAGLQQNPPAFIHNATLERVMIQQGWPRLPVSMAYKFEISIDRGQTFPISETVTPTQAHWGFEFVDVNVTSNVRRYRFRCPPETGAARPSWRGYSEIYVPSGEFFPTDRPVGTILRELPPTGVE